MTGSSTRVQLAFVLWCAFGFALALSVGQGVFVAVCGAKSAQNSGRVADGVHDVSVLLSAVRGELKRASSGVAEISGSVREQLAAGMETGAADMKVIQRNVLRAIDSTNGIVEHLESVMEEAGLDEQTAGVIEDLLFDAEDTADGIRKEALPLVRASVARFAETADESNRIAQRIAEFAVEIEASVTGAVEAEQSVAAVAGTASDNARIADQTRWTSIVAAIVAFFLGIGVPIVLVPRIRAEVGRSVSAMEAVAAGDLSQRIDARHFTEFARIAAAANRAFESMESAVTLLRGGMREMNDSSSRLRSTSGVLTGVAAEASRMRESMQAVATGVEDSVSATVEVSGQVERGENQIEALAKAAGEVGEISLVIQKIADMTNLLAVNASIEATHAGEAGRGFSVVAAEVGELAQKSSTAADSIRERIESIQSASREAIDVVQGIGGRMRTVTQQSKEMARSVLAQQETTQRIAGLISSAAGEAQGACQTVLNASETNRSAVESLDRTARLV